MKPPGHTCPGIDEAIVAARRLGRAASALADVDSELQPYADALNEAVSVMVVRLNRVRAENAQMRAAWVEKTRNEN